MDERLREAAEIIRKAVHVTAFTGAGISVESGIPPFRGPEGLWSRYDPKILEISYFHRHPEKSWLAIKSIFYDFFGKVEPNAAHISLARLESAGIIKAIITQNIDNLHQEAGSENVYEYHGNYSKLLCPNCGTIYDVKETNLNQIPPLCPRDGDILKPDFVFFGEQIPQTASAASYHEASVADVFLLVGTTGEVMPANLVPRLAKQNGASIIEINPEPSNYTQEITDVFLQGRAGEILPGLVNLILEV